MNNSLYLINKFGLSITDLIICNYYENHYDIKFIYNTYQFHNNCIGTIIKWTYYVHMDRLNYYENFVIELKKKYTERYLAINLSICYIDVNKAQKKNHRNLILIDTHKKNIFYIEPNTVNNKDYWISIESYKYIYKLFKQTPYEKYKYNKIGNNIHKKILNLNNYFDDEPFMKNTINKGLCSIACLFVMDSLLNNKSGDNFNYYDLLVYIYTMTQALSSYELELHNLYLLDEDKFHLLLCNDILSNKIKPELDIKKLTNLEKCVIDEISMEELKTLPYKEQRECFINLIKYGHIKKGYDLYNYLENNITNHYIFQCAFWNSCINGNIYGMKFIWNEFPQYRRNLDIYAYDNHLYKTSIMKGSIDIVIFLEECNKNINNKKMGNIYIDDIRERLW